LISENQVDGEFELKPYLGIVKSVCGNSVPIIGRAMNIELLINGEHMKFSPLVVKKGSNYCIISIDVIVNYPEVVRKQLGMNINIPIKSKRLMINNVLETKCIEEFGDMFKHQIDDMNACKGGKHKIETGDAKPIYQRNFRVPVHYEAEIDKEIKSNYKLGIIRQSKSSWCSRIVPVKKKDGTLRLCIDYRGLNQVTKKDTYPLPRIAEILDKLSSARIFTTLDATKGYYQIELEEADKEKTAFAWKGGLYEFNRLPFGLCNAPATFQRIMDNIFRGCYDYVIPYLDDIIIFSRSKDEHRLHLRSVMEKLKEAHIYLNKSKCKFFKKEINILGNIVSEGIIKADPKK
ncbi:MAG: reverse transcriptase family protein, partial [Fusobacteriaceae bacterium]